MAVIKEENFNYLLRLYSQVGDFLAEISTGADDLPDVVVSFCTVTEKIFKIKLYNENPVLVYENTKIKECDALVAVIKRKELGIGTIKIRDALSRYNLMFENEFSEDEMQAILDIYDVRNNFLHGYKSDDDVLSDKESIIKKMGTVWEKISAQAVSIFGKDLIKANKPQKKYSEEELEKVLIEEVKTKIKPTINEYGASAFVDINTYQAYNFDSTFGLAGEKCPRCGSFGFSLDSQNLSIFPMANVGAYGQNRTVSDLYKCKRCGLELTKKEYERAKKIKND
jgi:hypothetical protein